MEKRLWTNTGVPLTSFQWVGAMWALTHEELERIDGSMTNPLRWETPSVHHSLAPAGRDEEYDPLAGEDI